MTESINLSCEAFVQELASKSPAPGGGGASALVGAIGMALGSMTASLTVGKEKYKDVEGEVKEILDEAVSLQARLLQLIDEDARAFEPLSKAYGLPSNTDEEKSRKAEVMEKCLHDACEIPLEIMRACCRSIELHSKLAKIGAKIAISDVGCGALCCKAALRAASLNVFVNTRLMKDEAYSNKCEDEANRMLDTYVPMAENALAEVESRLA